MIANIVSVSGGKDSTALWLLAHERGIPFIPVFADTGNEHSITYEYLSYLESKLGTLLRVKADFTEQFKVRRKNLPELWAKAGISTDRIERALKLLHPTGNPFLDLCMLKGRFPSSQAKFCSVELKQVPIDRYVTSPLVELGFDLISWQGVRAQESRARSGLDVVEEKDGITIYRPLITWTANDVFTFHKRHAIKWNPLYESGMSRVGCMPCINCRKGELAQIAQRFPGVIERIREWEFLVSCLSKRGQASFFKWDIVNDEKLQTIDDRVRWAFTTLGGKYLDLEILVEDKNQCTSLYGLCE